MANVLGGLLTGCSSDPMTGWFRDGCCRTDASDEGRHVICTRLTTEFLEFSKAVGNDLSTPRPEFGFEGLKPGDQWCLCATRWRDAFKAGAAPQVVLEATDESALEIVTLQDLLTYAIATEA
jgi:uncharacterized protein (DUF2237 family)